MLMGQGAGGQGARCLGLRLCMGQRAQARWVAPREGGGVVMTSRGLAA